MKKKVVTYPELKTGVWFRFVKIVQRIYMKPEVSGWTMPFFDERDQRWGFAWITDGLDENTGKPLEVIEVDSLILAKKIS